MIENSKKTVSSITAERRLFVFLILLILFFVFQRVSMLEFAAEYISSPFSDEMSSGALAIDILDGKLRASFFSYQFEHRSGDSLLEGLLLVPFFYVFGE